MPNKGLTVLLLILLAVNVLLLAAVFGAFGPEPLAGWMESPREPQRVEQQVRRERMELLPQSNAGSRPAAPRAAVPASVTLAAAHAAEACLELGGLSTLGAERATAALAQVPVEGFAREETLRWWVHLPAQPTREQAERKLAELRRRHVTDVTVLASGSPESHTVSLGLFRTREGAEHFLETLRGQGVRTALISDAPRAVSRQWLRVRHVDDAMRIRMEAVRQRLGAEDLQACTLAS
ncbi:MULTISPECIES: SPOR domain-containing protein [unclassified Cupriavidus]|uniref:SPOR domain-containing protein n=1 Tax=Cupriavidus sp. H19C3 TaxID=3241603 RepID=UPI003BF91979